MAHPRSSVAFALLLFFIAHGAAQAALNPRLLDYLRTRPKDKGKIVALLSRYLNARDYDHADLVARYLAKELGERSARVYQILAKCALERRDEAHAKTYAQEALRLDPGASVARRILMAVEPAPAVAATKLAGLPDSSANGYRSDARGGAPTPPQAQEPRSPELRVAPNAAIEEARRLYYEDRCDKALRTVDAELARYRNAGALLLKAKIQIARTEYTDAAKILTGLVERGSRDPEVYLALAELARETHQYTGEDKHLATAHQRYRDALAVGPDHGPALLSYAAFLYQLNQPALAAPMYQRAQRQKPFRTRETVLNDAMVQYLMGRAPEALDALQGYARTFGSDAASLRLEGMVLLRMDRKEEAGESLELSFKRNPSNLPLILTIVPVLVTMDQAERALKVISAAEAAHPDSRQVADLKSQIKTRVLADRDRTKVERGPFVFTYPRSLENRADRALELIFQDFDQAFKHMARVMDYRPGRVQVMISTVTGIDNPAYYSPDTDTITIGAQWFFREAGTGAAQRQARRVHASHMVKHEYAHQAFAHRVGVDDYRRVNQAIPLWMLEGIAEWAAGGVATLASSPASVKGLFRNGFLDYPAMDRNMQVINGSKDPSLNHKSYLQSYFIVKYLIGRGGSDLKRGLEQFLSFNRALVADNGRFDTALQRVYRLSLEDFRRGWTGQIELDVLRRAQPDLTSFAVPAEVEELAARGSN